MRKPLGFFVFLPLRRGDDGVFNGYAVNLLGRTCYGTGASTLAQSFDMSPGGMALVTRRRPGLESCHCLCGPFLGRLEGVIARKTEKWR